MNNTHPTATHLTDGELVRYLDHEVGDLERREVMRHLASCDACASRLQEVGGWSEVVTRHLATLDSDARADELTRARALSAARTARRTPARSPMRGLRIAAVAAVLAVVSLTVQPVRAWLVDRWAEISGADVVAPVATAPHSFDQSGSLVSFDPAGEIFTLEIDNAQSIGSLRVERGTASEVTARIVNGDEENLLVLPSGLRIVNDRTSTADYLITLSPDITLLQVIAGRSPIAIIELDGVEGEWQRTMPLHRVN